MPDFLILGRLRPVSSRIVMATAAVAAQGPTGAPTGAEGGQDWKGMFQQMMRTVMMFMFINAASKTIFQQQGAVQEGRNPTAPRYVLTFLATITMYVFSWAS